MGKLHTELDDRPTRFNAERVRRHLRFSGRPRSDERKTAGQLAASPEHPAACRHPVPAGFRSSRPACGTTADGGCRCPVG